MFEQGDLALSTEGNKRLICPENAVSGVRGAGIFLPTARSAWDEEVMMWTTLHGSRGKRTSWSMSVT